MKPLAALLGLPISGPLLGLGWLTRRIAEAVDKEMYSPEAIQVELLALERLLDTGAIDLATFESEEMRLLAMLDSGDPAHGDNDQSETAA